MVRLVRPLPELGSLTRDELEALTRKVHRELVQFASEAYAVEDLSRQVVALRRAIEKTRGS